MGSSGSFCCLRVRRYLVINDFEGYSIYRVIEQKTGLGFYKLQVGLIDKKTIE